jgi:tetratricopeptide (TPR) repeat protein
MDRRPRRTDEDRAPGSRRDVPGREGAAPRLAIPESVTADQLDPEATAELRTLPGDLAEVVARLLVAAGATDDPDLAYQYAKQARNLAARVGVVRETCAIAAYQAGEWSTALTEFRAARRLTGRDSYLPLMADCERALGRLDRALDLVTGPDARNADHHTRIELRIVESGIRRDQGLVDAAVVVLQIPELTDGRAKPANARLYYAYADALLAAGREDEAREWFGKAAAADVDGETDAAERCDELDDISVEDVDLLADEDEDSSDLPDDDADDDDADDDDADDDDADDDDADDDDADDDDADDSDADDGDADGDQV